MAPRHNAVVRPEREVMLPAGNIRPANAAWSFPVVIAKKKGGNPRFYVNYRAFDAIMTPYSFPESKIEESFDELAGQRCTRSWI